MMRDPRPPFISIAPWRKAMATHNLKAYPFSTFLKRPRIDRGFIFAAFIIGALIAFESFNYSTTDFALSDLLGDLRFAGIRWATILALAFCGIDFAGIARLFNPELYSEGKTETWYLFGAWLLAATMNAILTWWGVSIAIANHQTLSNAIISREILMQVVPVFVAIMVWLMRILIIGTLSVAGERIFSRNKAQNSTPRAAPQRTQRKPHRTRRKSKPAPAFRPAPKPIQQPDPSYHSVSMSAQSANKHAHQ
jgi:hypothetical protein